ncbi:J domain-containing protein [Synechococcus sp. CCY9201]|uniref:J domain-containing protein n=1 Tax=Synechococcus sp. CCY9201 TaxID=174697 RepID=UPI002B1F2EE5|nr:J domain-containing protein [Synechococcus sp. CCY9201]MEA5475717.1 J domain-containing protein [Synechococcus sp. CCY9201]
MSQSVAGTRNLYAVLGLTHRATSAEIKAAYRALVKQHHPDAGGDDDTILALNAAWEVLGDGERRRRYDDQRGIGAAASSAAASQAEAAAAASETGRGARRAAAPRRGDKDDGLLLAWLQQVYAPIDRLLGQVINPFPAQLRELAADPYDDRLMEAFCGFLAQSQAKIEKVEALFGSVPCPPSARGFGLSLYHCLSQVKDALQELERYTMGYVDGYLHDGREMLREAKQRRSLLKQERRRLEL